jgi:thiol-disulfide isomerase/thioredoxin
MIRFFRSSIVFLLLVLSSCSFTTSGSSQDFSGRQAPFTRFYGLDGNVYVTGDVAKSGGAIVFWSSSCSPSKSALQHLNVLAFERPDLNFLAVNLDELKDREKALSVMVERPNLLHAFSGNGVYDEAFIALRGNALPYMIVIDRTGKILAQTTRYSTAQSTVTRHLTR